MEALLDDIRENRSILLMQQLKNSLFDCAKNLKSNDETFHIETFPELRDKFNDLISNYVSSVQNLEAHQRAFKQLQADVMEDDENPNGGEPIDLDKFKLLYKQTFEQQKKDNVTCEVEAQVMLNAFINPTRERDTIPTGDEEIFVEQDTPKEIPKDPITKKNIKIAVRSKKCKHIYDQESIKSYIELKERNRSKVQCPVAGCSNKTLKISDLELDSATNTLIATLMA